MGSDVTCRLLHTRQESMPAVLRVLEAHGGAVSHSHVHLAVIGIFTRYMEDL
jgi:hypothetical protein